MFVGALFGLIFFVIPVIGMGVLAVSKRVCKLQGAEDYIETESFEESPGEKERGFSFNSASYPKILDYQLIECKRDRRQLIMDLKKGTHCREGPMGTG